jgi:hypothetical protein
MSKQSIVDELSSIRTTSLTAFESKVVNLLALHLVNERPQMDQVSLLARAGFRPSEIASLVGTTANTVSVILSKEKRERKSRKSKR